MTPPCKCLNSNPILFNSAWSLLLFVVVSEFLVLLSHVYHSIKFSDFELSLEISVMWYLEHKKIVFRKRLCLCQYVHSQLLCLHHGAYFYLMFIRNDMNGVLKSLIKNQPLFGKNTKYKFLFFTQPKFCNV